MKGKTALLALVIALVIGGCSRQNSIGPSPAETQLAGTDLRTLVLTSATDPRLPAPMAEAEGATADDWEMIKSIGSISTPTLFVLTLPNPVVYWNQLTTELGRARGLPPPRFARGYALTQVAIYDALVAGRVITRRGLADNALAAGAASEVSFYLFPLDSMHIKEAIANQVDLRHPDLRTLRSWFLGKLVGRLVVIYGQHDGSDAVFPGPQPTGDCIWTGVNPVLPMCGTWKTWITTSGAEFQPEPPYPCGSAQDLLEVEQVYDASLVRTPEQIAIVHKWADLPPPTIWNGYLNDRLISNDWSNLRSARAHAFLNVTMYDAFVSCWRTKYITYTWVARPFQRLAGRVPAFTTVITTPNFPTYTSGHSTISAAAAVVMGELFPGEQAFFNAEAEEAALSRFWGGIHFHHDDNQGLVVGRQIGEKTVRIMRHLGIPVLAGE